MRRFIIDDTAFPLREDPDSEFIVSDGFINDFTGFAYLTGYLSVKSGALFLTDYHINMYIKSSTLIKCTSDLNSRNITKITGFTTNVSQIIYGDKEKVKRISGQIKEILTHVVKK